MAAPAAAIPPLSNMPMANSREAPRFGTSASEFDTFFEDVEELGRRANLDVVAMIKWARRYAGAESDSWQYVPCLQGNAVPASFDIFRDEVMAKYPNLSKDRRFTINDLNRLVNRTSEYIDMSRDDLGAYERKFSSHTEYLIGRGRLSTRERSDLYLKGFPQPVRARILQRLSIVKSQVLPEEGYEYADVHEAALFVLSSGGQAFADSSSPPVGPKAEPRDQDPRLSELINAVSQLTRVVTQVAHPPHQSSRPQQGVVQMPSQPPQPAPGGANSNTPPWNRTIQEERRRCSFCGDENHFIAHCHIVEDYIKSGKVVRNSSNKIVLPNGQFVPRKFPGVFIQNRVDSYYRSVNQNQQPIQTNFIETSDDFIFSVDYSSTTNDRDVSPSDDCDASSQELIQTLQAQIRSIRDSQAFNAQREKKTFDGVDVSNKQGPPRRNSPSPPQPSRPQDSGARPNVYGRPGARPGVDKQPPSRPQGPMKPVEIHPKSSDDAKHRYRSPIESSIESSSIVDRALDAKIEISTRELLASSADIRKFVKDLLTSKKVSANSVEPVDDSYLSECFENVARAPNGINERTSDDPSSAASSLPLRVIFPSFGDGVEPECILDGGAQVVIMRKDVWEKLHTPITKSKATVMEAANATVTSTLGLVEQLPVSLGPITVYLQVQIVEEAPFEVLLGRPFFDVMSCIEVSRPGGHHEIHVTDPKTHIRYVFATQDRRRPPPRNDHSKTAVNFRV